MTATDPLVRIADLRVGDFILRDGPWAPEVLAIRPVEDLTLTDRVWVDVEGEYSQVWRLDETVKIMSRWC